MVSIHELSIFVAEHFRFIVAVVVVFAAAVAMKTKTKRLVKYTYKLAITIDLKCRIQRIIHNVIIMQRVSTSQQPTANNVNNSYKNRKVAVDINHFVSLPSYCNTIESHFDYGFVVWQRENGCLIYLIRYFYATYT